MKNQINEKSNRIYNYLLLVLVLFYQPAGAQIKIYENYKPKQGLVQSQVRAIMEDHNGFLWLGTMGGLSRWDGAGFKNYYPKDGLLSTIIYDLYEDSSGTIYIGFHNGLGVMKNDTIRQLSKFEPLRQKTVSAIFIGDDETIYAGTASEGVFIFRDDGYDTLTQNIGLASGQINDLIQTPAGELVIATSRGISVYDGRTITTFARDEGLLHNYVHTLLLDDDGSVLIGTLAGVNVYGNGRISTLSASEFKDLHDIICMVRGNKGDFYFGTQGYGVFHIYDHHVEVLTEDNGLLNNFVYDTYVSKDGHAFFAVDAGLSVYQPGIMETYNQSTGMSNSIAWAILEAQDGELYFTTMAGVERFDGKEFHLIPSPDNLDQKELYAIHQTVDGTILVGSAYGIWQIKNGRMIRVPALDEMNDYLIMDIKSGPDGTLYFATFGEGLWIFSGGKLKKFTTDDGLTSNDIFTIFFSEDNEILLGTESGGVCRLKDGVFSCYSIDYKMNKEIVYVIYRDKKGRLYFGTESGLYIQDNGNFEQYNGVLDIPFNSIMGILEDSGNNIYLATEKGLVILTFSHDSISARRLTTHDGLASDEFNQGAFLKVRDGSMWFGTLEGVNHYFPDNDTPDTTPPTIFISEISVFDKKLEINTEKKLKLDYNENFLKFIFQAIDLESAHTIKYRFRLSKIDPDWVESDKNFIQYTNLSPGKYVFEVKGRNGWGVWSKPVKFEFQIKPAWWNNIWAWMVYLMLIVLFSTSTYRRKLKKVETAARLKEAELKAQAAEAEKKALQAESQRKNQEFEQARDIQLMMLPQKPPQISYLDIDVYMKTASEVGGDYYDFFPQNDNTLYVVTGDATGHGIPAGMMVAVTKSALKTTGARPLELILKRVNYVLKDIIPAKLHMSLNITLIDENKIEFASASMPPLLIYRLESNQVEELTATGLPLGFMEETLYESFTSPFHSGDILVYFTNGLPETKNKKNKPLGISKIKAVVLKNSNKSASDILAELLKLCTSHRQDLKTEDDITIVVIKHI